MFPLTDSKARALIWGAPRTKLPALPDSVGHSFAFPLFGTSGVDSRTAEMPAPKSAPNPGCNGV